MRRINGCDPLVKRFMKFNNQTMLDVVGRHSFHKSQNHYQTFNEDVGRI